MVSKTLVAIACCLLWARVSECQLVQRERTPAQSGSDKRLTLRASEPPQNEPAKSDQVDALTQVAVQATGNDATARLQALTLYLSPTNDRLRFYLNSQLPLKTTDAATGSNDSVAKNSPVIT